MRAVADRRSVRTEEREGRSVPECINMVLPGGFQPPFSA
jgi:hypothetical protein